MSILCITNDFGPRAGGIETFVIGLIERFPQGSTIVYTSSQGDTREYDQAWFDDYGVTVIRDRSHILLPTPRVTRNVIKVIEERKIKSVWFGAAAPLALMAGRLRKHGVDRAIALTHGHEVWWAKIPPLSWGIRSMGANLDHLTYLGDFTRKAISGALTVDAQKKMVHIAPGIDVDHFIPVDATELRRSLGLEGKRIIVSVGRLVPRKGQDVLIKALPSILEKVPDAHLLMVGEGKFKKKIDALILKHNLQSHVTFTGRIQYKDLPRYICVGDIFAMPSRSRFFGLEVEGLGIVYLEASACGLPVVAGGSGGAPDAVKEGFTGFVVDGRSSQSVAGAVIEILNDPHLSASMSKAGRRWIVEEWRWQIWSEKFTKLFQ